MIALWSKILPEGKTKDFGTQMLYCLSRQCCINPNYFSLTSASLNGLVNSHTNNFSKNISTGFSC